MLVRCPTCGQSFDFDQSTAKPFCSDRCRQIDLGRWLTEKHSVPVIRKDEDDEGEHRDDSNEEED